MMAEERVTHPAYYNSTRVECIDMVERICEGYDGVAAFDIGQCKYLNRAGLKEEEGLTIAQKAVEDLQKFRFYLMDFYERANRAYFALKGEQIVSADAELPDKFWCGKDIIDTKMEKKLLAIQFCAGRPRETPEQIKLCDAFEIAVESIWCMRKFVDVRMAIESVDYLIGLYSDTPITA